MHFDSIGVPSLKEMVKEFGSEENWQKETVYKWIHKMLSEYQDKKFIIFEGQVNFKFIEEGFAKNNFFNYETILIDCNEEVIGKKIK